MRKRSKRCCALLLACLLTLGLMPIALADGDTVYLDTAEDLAALSKNCRLDTWSQGKTVVLRSDLSLDEVDFQPIPSFGGVFDGGGHVISGLSLTDSAYPTGLFGMIQSGGVVKDLIVTGSVRPSGDAEMLGGLAGINYGKLSGCRFEGVVDGKTTVGGLIGCNEVSGQAVNCIFVGTLTGEHYVGGIAGQNLGSLVRCENLGNVNTAEIDVSVELPDLQNLDSTENMPAGTDIGGIAGFSSGLIQNCQNTGSVGYAHMGYNVGGIAGRQSGCLDGCVNMGTVLGRKDVGGIAGQMEPQVTLRYDEDTLQSLWDELDVMENLLNGLLSTTEHTTDALSGSMNSLTDSVGTVKDSVSDLADAMVDWTDGSLDQINDASARLSWLLDQMDPIMDSASNALLGMEDAVDRAADAIDDLAVLEDLSDDLTNQLKDAMDDLQTAIQEGGNALSEMGNAMDALSGSLEDSQPALSDLGRAVVRLADAFADSGSAIEELIWLFRTADWTFPVMGDFQAALQTIREALRALADAFHGTGNAIQGASGTGDSLISALVDAMEQLADASRQLDDAGGTLADAMDDLRDALDTMQDVGDVIGDGADGLTDAADLLRDATDLLRQAVDQARDAVNTLAEKPDIQFDSISGEITDKGDALDAAMDQMLDRVESLTSTMSNSSGNLTDDLRAVQNQMSVILDVIQEGVDDARNEENADHFEDVSDQEIDTEQTSGRLSASENAGSVEGDINVGGIVGSLAIEYDFDPEDDLTENGDRSLDFRYQAAAVVTHSINSGTVTGKKNCAGGIVGRMDLGSVHACEGCGIISSTDGDNVGGIAGESRATIRDCFAKCTLSGGRYVGGILGLGEEDSITKRCYSLVRILEAEQYAGAIAGSEDGFFADNAFVSDDLAGLGRVSYAGKAAPISYDALTAVQTLPDSLKTFTLTFAAEEQVLKEESFRFGDSFDSDIYPEIPEKEGYYAHWDRNTLENLQFDTTVTAVYKPYLTALASTELRENGRPIFYAEGLFRDGDSMAVQASEVPDAVEAWTLTLPSDGQSLHTIRYLPPTGAKKMEVRLRTEGSDDWIPVTFRNIGQYQSFDLEGMSGEIAVYSHTAAEDQILLLVPILLVLAVILILLRSHGNRRRQKPAASSGGTAEASSETGTAESSD